MMIRIVLIGMLGVPSAALAMQPFDPPGLLPTEIARSLLDQTPSVVAARAGLNVARQEAGILDRSPYEWTPRVTVQQRRVDHGSQYTEWNAGIERTIRLPGKAAADRKIGDATVQESQARYGEALQEAARDLLERWVDWLGAERARELAANNLQSIQEGLAAVETRARANDASKLDLSLAGAEVSEQKRVYNDAKTLADVAWSRLSSRFPKMNRQSTTLPAPAPIGEDETFWRERILAESDELKVAQLQIQKAQAQAERARADKIPDPTLGIFTASESGGAERIAGIMISIPIPGGGRDLRSAKATAEIEVSRQDFEVKKSQLEAEIASAIATAQGAYESLQFANEGAAIMQENARLLQRAYALGEAELQSLLLARRQATSAINNVVQTQITALKAYYGLLVDAHLIWDLEKE